MSAASKAAWRRGMQDVHRDAAGAIEITVVQQQDMLAITTAMLEGDYRAAQLFDLAAQTLAHIKQAPARSATLCACCPRPIRSNSRFSLVMAIPARDSPRVAMTIAVCDACATGVLAVQAKAIEALRTVWPDLRAMQITHPEGSRA